MEKRDYIIQVIFADGTSLAPVIRKTQKGISNYCNRMFAHYFKIKGDEFTCGMHIEVGHFDDNMDWHLDNTWAC